MDDVRLLLSTHGEVLSVLTDITKKHGIQTGGVRFAIRLHEDQSMPNMLTILNVNYAVLYAGKRQKVHISTSTTNSAPVENSARVPASTGRDTSIVTTETESSTENNPIHTHRSITPAINVVSLDETSLSIQGEPNLLNDR